jgi:hypothetical protein
LFADSSKRKDLLATLCAGVVFLYRLPVFLF